MSVGIPQLRGLDFIVIGAQKAGTTSLWRYLRGHPRLRLPRGKEVAVFTVANPSPVELASAIPNVFDDVRPDSLLGTVSPNYMIGSLQGKPGDDVEAVARRIAGTCPAVKLIAVLRDPIERAASSYKMAFRRGQEKRPIDDALSDLLEPGQLSNSRRCPTDPNSLVVAGEYGRVLGVYRALFPAEQLHLAYTADLARDPGAVLDGMLGFLGLETGFRPQGLGIRHFRGGRRRLLDRHAEELLFNYFREDILPYMRGSVDAHEKAFEFFYMTWNVAPDEQPPELSAEVRMRLEAHYRDDARKLAELGIRAPWIQRWEVGVGLPGCRDGGA